MLPDFHFRLALLKISGLLLPQWAEEIFSGVCHNTTQVYQYLLSRFLILNEGLVHCYDQIGLDFVYIYSYVFYVTREM